MTADIPFIVSDNRKQHYFTIDNVLLDRYGKQLGAHGIAVYAALARFANRDSECWPSRSAISDRTGVSRAQVNRELNKLVELNIITITPQFNEKGDQTSNLYTLLDIVDGGITQRPPPLSRREPPVIRVRPKQSLKKKDTPRENNKKYKPDEYKDYLLP